MSAYISTSQTVGFKKGHKKNILLVVTAAAVLAYSLYESHSTSFYQPTISSQPPFGAALKNPTEFQKQLKATYPEHFKITAGGSLMVRMAPQAFYFLHTNNTQEVQTSKVIAKEKLLYQLNHAGIAYNIKEQLGVWVIQWNDFLYLPVL